MNVIAGMIDEWQSLRAEIAAMERAEHPDVTDALGRTWQWKSGDIYTHDGMAWPLIFIQDPNVGLPKSVALDNPNYSWCEICKPGDR